MALYHLVLMIHLLMEDYQPQPLMVTCLPILHKATLLSSLNSYLRTVMFILMVQCILKSLLSLSSTMDLLNHILPSLRMDILLLLLMGMLIPRTIIMDSNLLTHLHHTQSMLHLTNRCHPYSQHLRKRT